LSTRALSPALQQWGVSCQDAEGADAGAWFSIETLTWMERPLADGPERSGAHCVCHLARDCAAYGKPPKPPLSADCLTRLPKETTTITGLSVAATYQLWRVERCRPSA